MTRTAATLLNKAKRYWSVDAALPVDLYMELTNEGIDVDAEEEKYQSKRG
jgi:hypothetical protein